MSSLNASASRSCAARPRQGLTKAFQTLAQPSEDQKCLTHAHTVLEEQRAWSQCRKHLLHRNPTKPRAWHMQHNFQQGNLTEELKNSRWTRRSLPHSHCLVGTSSVWTVGCEPSAQEDEEIPLVSQQRNTKQEYKFLVSAGAPTGEISLSDFTISPLEYYMFSPAKTAYPVSLKILLRTILAHNGIRTVGKYLKIIPITPHWQKYIPEAS